MIEYLRAARLCGASSLRKFSGSDGSHSRYNQLPRFRSFDHREFRCHHRRAARTSRRPTQLDARSRGRDVESDLQPFPSLRGK